MGSGKSIEHHIHFILFEWAFSFQHTHEEVHVLTLLEKNNTLHIYQVY